MSDAMIEALEQASVPSAEALNEWTWLFDMTVVVTGNAEEATRQACRSAAVADLAAIVRATLPHWDDDLRREVLWVLLRERLAEFNDSAAVYVGTGDYGNGPLARVSKDHLVDLLTSAPASDAEEGR